LWWGNSVFTYDAHPAVRTVGRVSRALEQLVAIAVGVHPRIKALTTTENIPQLERMKRLRWSLLTSAVLLMAFFIVLLGQIFLLVRRSRRRL
jgi:heme/copper-type cytochrome/quinol oxidase subunit 1